MSQQIMVPGATAVGIKCKDGVVLGNDRRATWGYTVTNKTTQKLFKITDNVGLAAYGLIGDFQFVSRVLKAQAVLYELDANDKISTKSVAKMLSNMLYARKMAPLYTSLIIGGVDKEGPQIYTLDGLGSVIPEEFGATGTGMLLSMGILEADYKPDMSIEDGVKLVEKAIRNSIKRDAMSGNGIDLLIITKDGSEERRIEIKELGE
ncbi:MAG: archaeal proteasome endopeptidase complex subunit beta [Promethearchaeota archaeon]|nr:MAG: archaeal proteasome endopeptidase complex subunit beta [Candidatus Lokiarchaeota archaeon]